MQKNPHWYLVCSDEWKNCILCWVLWWSSKQADQLLLGGLLRGNTPGFIFSVLIQMVRNIWMYIGGFLCGSHIRVLILQARLFWLKKSLGMLSRPFSLWKKTHEKGEGSCSKLDLTMWVLQKYSLLQKLLVIRHAVTNRQRMYKYKTLLPAPSEGGQRRFQWEFVFTDNGLKW